MDEEKKVENEPKKEETKNDGIIVESIEDDMKANGIEPEPADPKDEETKKADDTKNGIVNPNEGKPRKGRAQRRIESQQRRIHQLEAQIDKSKTASAKKDDEPSKNEEGKEPVFDDYDDYDEYIAALEAYEKSTVKKDDEKQTTEPGQSSKEDKNGERITEVLEDGKEDYENFQEVVSAKDLQLSQPLLDESLKSEFASDVLYYLGTHKDESARISELSPKQIEREVVKIEIKLEESEKGNKDKPKVKKITNAPEPINPVSKGSEQVKTLDDDDISFTDYERLANEKRKKNAGGFL